MATPNAYLMVNYYGLVICSCVINRMNLPPKTHVIVVGTVNPSAGMSNDSLFLHQFDNPVLVSCAGRYLPADWSGTYWHKKVAVLLLA